MTRHSVDEYPPAPLHSLLISHKDGCPPGCPWRAWADKMAALAEAGGTDD